MQTDLVILIAGVAERLTRSGAPGIFCLTTTGGAVCRLEWTGAEMHRGEAERDLVGALTASGYDAEPVLGFGVRVRNTADAMAA